MLQEESRLRETSFRSTLNDVIREGLAAAGQRRSHAATFRVKPRSMGLRLGLSDDSISKLIELGEGEGAR